MTTMLTWERELTLIDVALLLGAALQNGQKRSVPLSKTQLVETLYQYPELGISAASVFASKMTIEYQIVRLWSKGFLDQTRDARGTWYSVSTAGYQALQKTKQLFTFFTRALYGI